MRTTSKDVRIVFERFCRHMGKRVGKYSDKGSWGLDHNGIYGGYVIVEYLPSGGEDLPFGPNRMKAAQFVEAMHFAMRACPAKG